MQDDNSVFEILASAYDQEFTSSPIGRWQRSVVWNYLENELSQGKLNVLEINCGTGEDAIFFSRRGSNVIATDISGKMIEIACKRAGDLGLDIRFGKWDLRTPPTGFAEQQFELVFSNFGGLNCIAPNVVQNLFRHIFDLVKVDGQVFLIVMPDRTLLEDIYFLVKGKYKLVGRRRSDVFYERQGIRNEIWYHTPDEMTKWLYQAGFKGIKYRPVSFLPSYLNQVFEKRAHLAMKLDKFLSRFTSLSRYADHYLISAVRRYP